MIEIAKDSTGNTATFEILDSDGAPDTGVAYNAAGLVVFYTPHGGTQVVITLSSENWHEKGNGWYEVDVADAVYASVRVLDFGGVITDGHVIGERQSVVEDLYSEAGVQDAAAAAIAAAGIATEDKQDDILADIAAIVPAGGIYTQTVTVKTTGGAAIPNATVAIYSGSVLIDTKTTNSSGIAQPMCDAGSYTLRVTATGYASYSAALAVTGDATLADIVLSSSETTITPSADQAKTTAYWIVYGADTMPVGEDDVTATIWIIKMPSDHGAAYVDNPVQTISTTTNGILSATLFKGATYQIALSDGREWVVEVPLKAGTTYKMPPIRVAEA